MRGTSEQEWLIPAIGLTLLSGTFALAFLPDYSGILPSLELLPWWLIVAALAWAVCGPVGFFPMMLKGVRNPLQHLARSFIEDWKAHLLLGFGIVLAGLNMVTFMWTKPLLNQLVPFWADPMLARLDNILFLGHDPWRFLGWLNSMPMAIFYHRGWFALMIATLLLVLSRPASSEKSSLLLSYFLLWTLFGPIVHCLLPAGGPIFFEHLGYGDRFAGIQRPHDMVLMSDYLWTSYATGGFGPGSGISAMPSLHIATTAWMVIAVRVHAPRMTWVISVFALLIFLLSISLGWHYALDGLVGGAGALAFYRLSRRFYGRQQHHVAAGQPVGAKA